MHGSYPTTVGEDGTWEVQMNCCDKATNQVLQYVDRIRAWMLSCGHTVYTSTFLY